MFNGKADQKVDVWFIAIIGTWAVLTYALALLLFNMYTSEDSAVLFWCAVVVFTPAGIYFAIPMAARENAKWYKFLGYSIMISLFLVFMGYFTLLKTDLLWSLFTKPTTSGILYIKNVKKDYLPKHGWDHTNVNTIYNNKPLEFEATRTAYFLLKDKDSLNVTIGRSIVGNYFITDIHLPGTERWAARKSYWINWVERYIWVAVFLVFAFMVVQLKERYFPNITFAQIGWKRFVLLCVAIMVGIIVLIYISLIIYMKFIHKV
jgi:hypothetical protein